MPVGKQKSKDKRIRLQPREIVLGLGSGLSVDEIFGEGVKDAIEVPAKLPQILIHHWIKTHVPLAQIEKITALACAVIEDDDQAVKWLSEPCLSTDNRPPIDLIGEPGGFERVKNLLLRIEYGVLA